MNQESPVTDFTEAMRKMTLVRLGGANKMAICPVYEACMNVERGQWKSWRVFSPGHISVSVGMFNGKSANLLYYILNYGYLLACDKVTVTTSGKTQEAYKLLRKPILYEYSQVSKQIINVPIALLQTSGAVRGTEEVIVIRGYLLRQIIGMKSKTFARSNKITYEGIYSELDMEDLTGKPLADKSRKVRSHVDALLSEWMEQEFIKDFTVYKEGKTHKGVAITL